MFFYISIFLMWKVEQVKDDDMERGNCYRKIYVYPFILLLVHGYVSVVIVNECGDVVRTFEHVHGGERKKYIFTIDFF